jgi:hypothetical protein
MLTLKIQHEYQLTTSRFLQGWFVAVPILSTFVGLVLVAVGGFSCSIVDVEYNGSSRHFQFGNCNAHGDDYSYDPAHHAGYALAVLATVIGALTVVSAISTSFVRFPRGALWGMSIASFVVAALGYIVCGAMFGTEICNVGSGSTRTSAQGVYLMIVGGVFWIAAGVSFLFVKRYEQEEVVDEIESSVSPALATPVFKDTIPFSTPITETVTNPDGTKTRPQQSRLTRTGTRTLTEPSSLSKSGVLSPPKVPFMYVDAYIVTNWVQHTISPSILFCSRLFLSMITCHTSHTTLSFSLQWSLPWLLAVTLQ